MRLENKRAMPFKTIDLRNTDISNIFDLIPNFSNIRIIGEKNKESDLKIIKELKHKYPNVRFTIKLIGEEEKNEVSFTRKELYQFKINKDNIKELILNEIEEKDDLLIEELDNLIR